VFLVGINEVGNEDWIGIDEDILIHFFIQIEYRKE
jgi:hypothetical protein